MAKLLEPYFLDLEVYNTASVELRCDILALDESGDMFVDSFAITPALTTGAKNSIPMKRALPKGELISVNVSLVTAGIQRGQCFVASRILTSENANATKVFELFSGYVTSNSPVGFPGTGLQSSLDGVGYKTYIQDTTTDQFITLQNDYLFLKIDWVVVSLIPAVVSNPARRVFLSYNGLPGNFYAADTIAEGTSTEIITFINKLGYSETAFNPVDSLKMAMPDMVVNGDMFLYIGCSGSDDGDQWAVTYYVEQWIRA
jgi:hypothetical protein